MPEVILVHGLWYGRTSTALLKRRLEHAGFRVSTFTYSSIFRKPGVAAARLARWIKDRAGHETHLVGHSLGGLIILRALAILDEPYRGRIVMLGTPLNGSNVARSLARWPLLNRLLGYSRRILVDGMDPQGSGVEIGMIAGSSGLGLGKVTGAVNEPSDGTVLLSETRHPSLKAHTVVKVGHTGLLFSAAVADRTIMFLREAHFDHG